MNAQKCGEMINEYRKRKSMTQQELAELLGVTNKAVSKWENGHSFPDITLIVPLCEALELPVETLLQATRQHAKEQSFAKRFFQKKFYRYHLDELKLLILSFLISTILVCLLYECHLYGYATISLYEVLLHFYASILIGDGILVLGVILLLLGMGTYKLKQHNLYNPLVLVSLNRYRLIYAILIVLLSTLMLFLFKTNGDAVLIAFLHIFQMGMIIELSYTEYQYRKKSAKTIIPIL